MLNGHCLCGDIAYEIEGKPLWLAYCHCASCRRQTASPVTLFFGANRQSVTWLHGEPAVYNSSPGVSRSFCALCGTPICYSSSDRPDEIDFYHGTLARPESLSPADMDSGRHVYVGEQIAWFEIFDSLPRYHAGSWGGASPLRHGPRPKDG